MGHDYKAMVRHILTMGRKPRGDGFGRPRWAIARDLFYIERTSAKQLCRDLGLDPDEMWVHRI